MADYTIRGDTKLDASGLNSALNRLSGMAKAGLGALATAGAAAATAVAGVSVASVKLASDLTEVQNVVDVTFGDNAAVIEDWAKSARDAYGLSTLAAKQYTGTLGAMLKSMGLTDDAVLQMSTDMVGLAGDFASFYNLDAADAFYKIRAGISGETEPLKELGINMSVANLEAYALSQGITKTYKEMDQAEQATLRYNYLMSVSADAQGDFVRTQDSLANQMRIATLQVQEMGAAIGSALLPTATEALKATNEMLSTLREGFEQGGVEGLFDAAQTAITNFVTWLSGQLPGLINSALGLLSAIVAGLYNALPTLLEAVGQVLGILWQAVVAALPGATQALGELIEGVTQWLTTTLPNEIIPVALQAITTFGDTVAAGMPEIIARGGELLAGLAGGIAQALPQLLTVVLAVIMETLITLADSLPEYLRSGADIIESMIDGIGQSLPSLLTTAANLMLELVITIINHLPEIISAGYEIIVAMIRGIGNALPGLISAAAQIYKAILDSYSRIDWIGVGRDIIWGIINGIGSMAGALWDAAWDVAHAAWDAIVGFFQIGSPSKLMRDEVGKMLPRGLAIGIDADTDTAVDATNRMAEEMLAAAQSANLDAQLAAYDAAQVTVHNQTKDTASGNPDAPGKAQIPELTVVMDGRKVGKIVAPYVDERLG